MRRSLSHTRGKKNNKKPITHLKKEEKKKENIHPHHGRREKKIHHKARCFHFFVIAKIRVCFLSCKRVPSSALFPLAYQKSILQLMTSQSSHGNYSLTCSYIQHISLGQLAHCSLPFPLYHP